MMYLSSISSTRLVSFSILIVLAIQLPLIQSLLSLNKTNAYLHHICFKSEGKSKLTDYEDKATKFVKKMINSMPTEYGYGFTTGIKSGPLDQITAKMQCRGDISDSECHSCLLAASSSISKRCPGYRGRTIWYDNCLLDVSPIYRYTEIDYRHNFYLHNPKDVRSDTISFNKKTRDLLNRLKEKATNEENNIPETREYMYVTGEENLGKVKLYAMMQCTQDLSLKNCSVCLDWIMTKLPKCCNNKQGGRGLSVSCNFRYELYPFVKT